MSKRRSQKKFIFSLKFGSTISEIHQKYNINIPINGTRIEEEKISSITFNDELRKLRRYCISMVDFSDSKSYACFWDRHHFTTTPIGCPITYKPSVMTRTYNSEISHDTFVVRESVPKNQVINTETNTLTKEEKNYYETDGIFCSFNCALAFALDNRHNPLYSQSVSLIHRLYKDVSVSGDVLVPAPSWRLLDEYGGAVTIEKFRSDFTRAQYDYKGVYRQSFKPLGLMYEEKIKL
jgi:hypothetical protein